MFYGLVGDVARAAAEGTEVNPVSAAAALMSFLSTNVGRDVYLPVGNVWHHARLFTCHVGRSGRGGKGDAVGLVNRIRRRVEEVYAGTLGQSHTGGLSTREGLALLIHDGYKDGKTEIPPIDDKRLWVVESEFANVLHQGKRDGNTLSAALRDAWDGVSIRPAIKSSRVWASRPHIGLHCCITPGELLNLLESRDLSNGFANRFLFVWAESTGTVPFPAPTDRAIVNTLADRVVDVVNFARGKYPAERDSRRMSLSQEAADIYAKEYRKLRRPSGGERIVSLLERQAPYTLRLGMLFALTDKSLVIEARHLRAALAWAKYARESVEFIFGEQAASQSDAATAEDARKILDFLKNRPDGATLTGVGNECFGKKLSAARIGKAIRWLLTANPPRIVEEKIPRADGMPGKPRQIFILAADLADLGEIETGRGFQAGGLRADLGGHSFSGEQDADLIPPNSAKSATGASPSGKPNSAISAKSARDDEIVENVRVGYNQEKGFERSQFEEAFSRYLPSPPEISVPPSQAKNDAGLSGTERGNTMVKKLSSVPLETAPHKGWDGGTDKKGETGKIENNCEVF
jgi:hypothetical protein